METSYTNLTSGLNLSHINYYCCVRQYYSVVNQIQYFALRSCEGISLLNISPSQLPYNKRQRIILRVNVTSPNTLPSTQSRCDVIHLLGGKLFQQYGIMSLWYSSWL